MEGDQHERSSNESNCKNNHVDNVKTKTSTEELEKIGIQGHIERGCLIDVFKYCKTKETW